MSLQYGYADLQAEIAFFLGWGREPSDSWDTDTLDAIIRSGLAQFYSPSQFDPRIPAHSWSFMRPESILTTVAPYKTGTVVIASGVVTLTGGTFPSWAASGFLVVQGIGYAITSRDSNTQVTLTDLTVNVSTSSTYNLSCPAVDLPSAFGGFEGPLTYEQGGGAWQPLRLTSESEIRRMWQHSPIVGRPVWVAYRSKAFDPTQGQQSEILYHPFPDAAYRFRCRYRVIPDMISAEDPYPLGGPEHAETILESCLAIAEQRVGEPTGLHVAAYRDRLLASIERDRQASSPDFLGYNGDHSDRPDVPDHLRLIPSNLIFTYKGLT